MSALLSGFVLLLLVIMCVTLVTLYKIDLPEQEIWLTVGIIGFWRYSWKTVHAFRGIYYQTVKYPKLKAIAQGAKKPSELLVIVPSYRSKPLINFRVYKKLFEELESFGVKARVAACITDPADIEIVETARQGKEVEIYYLPQNGKGKRVAMVEALNLFYQQGYSANAQLVLMDGDTLLSDNIFHKTCIFLSKYRDLGAVTCHNRALVSGASLVRQWYRQRLSQRHFYMNSVSLSHRLMVLTGRFSMFKANILLSPEFIHRLEYDYINHWRCGRLKMLTGDDKSSWFHLLLTGWKMLYLPDVVVDCLEEPAQGNFFRSSSNLMRRWYGNMLRNNGRALQLGPRHCGLFLWLCLLDQRVSIWTSLTGPVFALLLSVTLSPVVIAAYFVWVMFGRSLNCLFVASMTGQFHPMFIPLLWYEQVVGSALKVFVLFRLDRQKWTRQGISSGDGGRSFWGLNYLPRLLTLASCTSLVIVLAILHDIVSLPAIW